MYARTTTIEAHRIDEAVDQVKSSVLPLLDEQEGFKGFTLHVDRSGGKLVGTSYWESREAMEASEDAVKGPREQAAERGGVSGETVVEHFEVVIDTMA